jgi:glycosyltransferase involved in cell wall biosynthesis
MRNFVLLAVVDWNFLKQRAHHLAAGLAEAGNRVLYVENTGVRELRPADLPRLISRLRTAIAGAGHKTDPLPANLEVYSPLILPFPYLCPAVNYNFRQLRKAVDSFLERHSLKPSETILMSYLATPLVLQLAEALPWYKVVYDAVSDPKFVEPRLAPFERCFLQRADVTLFASVTLLEQYKAETRNPVLFRDGFSTRLLDVKAEIPPEILKLPRPRFLYLGGINRKFWIEAVEALAKSMPDASIILIGPVDSNEVTIPRLANIHCFQPVKRYDDLAGYLQAADVGLIPYRPDPYAGRMHPAKLNEYLVFGLPVVTTATAELERLAQELPPGTFYLAGNAGAFPQAALDALAQDTVDARAKRRELVHRHTWCQRTSQLMDIVN